MNKLIAEYQIATIEHLKRNGYTHKEACEEVFGTDDSNWEIWVIVSVFVVGVTLLIIFS